MDDNKTVLSILKFVDVASSVVFFTALIMFMIAVVWNLTEIESVPWRMLWISVFLIFASVVVGSLASAKITKG